MPSNHHQQGGKVANERSVNPSQLQGTGNGELAICDATGRSLSGMVSFFFFFGAAGARELFSHCKQVVVVFFGFFWGGLQLLPHSCSSYRSAFSGPFAF